MNSELLWAVSTWQLFHTMIEKASEEFFIKNKNIFFEIIKNICNNLPCPDCAEHARYVMNNININPYPRNNFLHFVKSMSHPTVMKRIIMLMETLFSH